jgi:hypothetical protein
MAMHAAATPSSVRTFWPIIAARALNDWFSVKTLSARAMPRTEQRLKGTVWDMPKRSNRLALSG